MRSAAALALCLAVVGLAQFAQAGPCPTEVCNAAFNQVDCCRESDYFPKFGIGARCQWYNAPVSFFNEGTCEARGKTFMMLRSSNSQGQANSLCRCKDPYVKVPAAPVKVTGFTLVGNQDIIGADIPCDGKSYCQVCGSLQSVVDRCLAGFKGTKCMAFTYDGACGYLKSAKGPVKYREGWIKYTKDATYVAPVAKPAAVAVVVVPVPVAKPVPKPVVPVKVAGFDLVSNQDIIGSDIYCDGRTFCQVCGSLDAVIERCNRGRCAAFTWDGKCGYLKNAAGPVKYREGFIKYTRNAPVAPVAKPVAKPGAVAVIILPVATAKPAAKPAVTINAGPCPTNFCKAAFNADDCCKKASYFPRFDLGAKCQWRNTPVSFTYEGMCEANGRAHMLLRSSNSQGAGTNLCRCQESAGPAKVQG